MFMVVQNISIFIVRLRDKKKRFDQIYDLIAIRCVGDAC